MNNYSTKSYRLTKEEYDYLLPLCINAKECGFQLGFRFLSLSRDSFYLIADSDSIHDVLNRLKGLYNNYPEELPDMLSYWCFTESSLNKFRELLKLMNKEHFVGVTDMVHKWTK